MCSAAARARRPLFLFEGQGTSAGRASASSWCTMAKHILMHRDDAPRCCTGMVHHGGASFWCIMTMHHLLRLQHHTSILQFNVLGRRPRCAHAATEPFLSFSNSKEIRLGVYYHDAPWRSTFLMPRDDAPRCCTRTVHDDAPCCCVMMMGHHDAASHVYSSVQCARPPRARRPLLFLKGDAL